MLPAICLAYYLDRASNFHVSIELSRNNMLVL